MQDAETAELQRKFRNPDSDFEFGITYYTDEMVKEMYETEPEEPQTAQELYEDTYALTDQEMEEHNAEADTAEVCGTKAKVMKWKNGDKGYVDMGTAWMCDGVCYNLWITNSKAFDEDGNVLEDAAVLSDEDIAMYDSVIASITPGDGTKYWTRDAQ